MPLNLEPLKEPRGFIRVIQVFLAILAFATTTDYKQQAGIGILCKKGGITKSVSNVSYELSYPFNIEHRFLIEINRESCGHDMISTHTATLDKESAAEFYVTTGVLSFLFSLGAIVIYVVMTETYENAGLFPLVDLVATGVLTFFWFISWCVWVAQEGNVKDWYHNLPGELCNDLKNNPTAAPPTPADVFFECSNSSGISFSKLTVSLVFGFGNIILWAGSTWFVYKDTHFHRKNEMRAEYPDQGIGGGGNSNPGPYQQAP